MNRLIKLRTAKLADKMSKVMALGVTAIVSRNISHRLWQIM